MLGIGYTSGAPVAPLSTGFGLHSDTQNMTSITTTATNQSSTNYTYEVIQVVPDTNGTYTFASTSSSNLQFYGYLYNGSFIPSTPLTILIARSDSLTGTLQFSLTSTLVEDSEYLLVVTTSNQTAMGLFNIIASGPALVAFTRRSVAASSDVDGVLIFAYTSQATMTFFTVPTAGSALLIKFVLYTTTAVVG
ncbi:unnamed protein product [Adineta ricciae]|uniref:Uncharacterized protein n=1 Tax=Adineta ricciae TaxID=249248 RepID=A0A815S7Z9_ADIRI|nr:unnamed protein product [Adineta ricciae]